MIPHLRSKWEDVLTSLWLIPGLIVFILVVLAFTLPQVDRRVDLTETGYVFVGDASAARTFLSVVAGSLITVVSLVFSITIVVLQQASTQFTPRILAHFMGSRGSQIVLGAFVGTFLYALFVLQQIRGNDNFLGGFVPEISVTVAIVLTGICTMLLVYFLHHTASSLQVPTIVQNVKEDVQHVIDRFYPEIGEPIERDHDLETFREKYLNQSSALVFATQPGFLRAVDEDAVVEVAGNVDWLVVHPRVGWYLMPGDLLVEVGGVESIDEQTADWLRGAFVLSHERSLHQDPLLGIRQLVDIALKALSPGINDPTTAEYALATLGDILLSLSRRPFPSRYRRVDRGPDTDPLEMWVNRPTFGDFVDGALAQIRRASYDQVHVLLYLIDVIGAVGRRVLSPERAEPLHDQIAEIAYAIDEGDYSPGDRELLRMRLMIVKSTISV